MVPLSSWSATSGQYAAAEKAEIPSPTTALNEKRMNCERGAVGETDGHDNPKPGISMTKISLKKLYEPRRREAAEPMHKARAKAGDALVASLTRMAIAYRSGGQEGLERHLHKRSVQLARHPKKDSVPPEMPAFNFGARQSLYELRPSALVLVEEHGYVTEPSLDVLRDHFLANYDKVFGRFRRRGDHEVPSDQLKKSILVERLVELIDQRRLEYAAERSRFKHAN
jgi:hypothetical protein